MSDHKADKSPFLKLFDEFKDADGHSSDAAAAKAIGLDRRRIHQYRKNESSPDAYACTRLALAARRDPITLIAEVEAAKETKNARGAFWRDFFRRVTSGGLLPALAFGLVLASASAICDANIKKPYETSHYTKWQRWISRILATFLTGRGGRRRETSTSVCRNLEPRFAWG